VLFGESQREWIREALPDLTSAQAHCQLGQLLRIANRQRPEHDGID
jgi:hypothetical protein